MLAYAFAKQTAAVFHAGPIHSRRGSYSSANNYWAAAILIGATFVAYALCLKGSFILDDEPLITHNPQVQPPDGLYRIWFTKEAFDYRPVTNTSFWLEWRMWGLDATGYRFTNLILHIVDSLLLWLVLAN